MAKADKPEGAPAKAAGGKPAGGGGKPGTPGKGGKGSPPRRPRARRRRRRPGRAAWARPRRASGSASGPP